MLDCVVARAASVVTGTEPPRLFTELGRHPRLFRGWLPFAGTLLLQGRLPRRDTELVVLRTAFRCRCRYEWAQHVHLAARSGLTSEEVDAVPEGASSTVYSERQRVLLQATDELLSDQDLQPDTTAALSTFLTEEQQIELLVLVGHYQMLAMVLNARRVEPEPAALARLGGRRAEVADELRREAATTS